MPRRNIDYSQTHFYKIICKDTSIKDIYVGHTTDFKTRKGCHKRVCNNPKEPNHNIPLYKFIRDNDGWENFDMIWLETKSYENSMEARKREREIVEELNASLNQVKPYRSVEEKKVYKQEWAKSKGDSLREYKHNWHLDNRDRLNEIKRQKYLDNKEEHLAKCKKYYQDNIEERRAIRNRVCQCSCGDTYTYANKKRHERTNFHQQYLQSLQD